VEFGKEGFGLLSCGDGSVFAAGFLMRSGWSFEPQIKGPKPFGPTFFLFLATT
jgi:hypothetical protein